MERLDYPFPWDRRTYPTHVKVRNLNSSQTTFTTSTSAVRCSTVWYSTSIVLGLARTSLRTGKCRSSRTASTHTVHTVHTTHTIHTIRTLRRKSAYTLLWLLERRKDRLTLLCGVLHLNLEEKNLNECGKLSANCKWRAFSGSPIRWVDAAETVIWALVN